MKIKSILNKLINRNKKVNKLESDNSYCYSSVIWNSEDYLILLLSFTEDYFEQIIELQDAVKNIISLRSKIIFSSYDEKTDKKDEDGNDIWIIHKKYYMLIGGHHMGFNLIYRNIHDLGNYVLSKITNEITNNCKYYYFSTLIEDGVLNGFIKNPQYDTYIKIKYTECVDPDVVLKRLPEKFTGRDLLRFIFSTCGDATFKDLHNLIVTDIQNMTEEQFKSSEYFEIYAKLFKNPTVEKLKMLLEPLYKQPDEDDDSIPGDISDESLDEIFRENYERFSAVADDLTQYEDIDEELDDGKESENMRKEDLIEDWGL